jgi:hypothetical protein
MCQFFLRQVLGPPEFPQIECQYLSYIHADEGTALQSIPPRSIFDKDAGATADPFLQVRGRCRNYEYLIRNFMKNPPLDPDVADAAPTDPTLTGYDQEHLVTYLRLLDADAEGADWREVARIVLHIDPRREPERARHAFDSHLARAKWMTDCGYRHLLRGGPSN